MVHSLLRRLTPAALVAAACATQAQTARPPARPDPLDPNANVPALVIQSPLKSYRRLDDEKPIPWREANDTVGRIGGWRVYVREAQQPEPTAPTQAAPSSPPAEMAQPAPAGHAGPKTP